MGVQVWALLVELTRHKSDFSFILEARILCKYEHVGDM
jgi:hypothetical protein